MTASVLRPWLPLPKVSGSAGRGLGPTLARFVGYVRTILLSGACAYPQFPAANVVEHAYYDADTKSLDFEGMVSDLKSAPAGSIVVLHAWYV